MKRLLSNNKGFTLIELMVVISLISILMGTAITAVSAILDNSRKKHM